jgi:hypothetical protein
MNEEQIYEWGKWSEGRGKKQTEKKKINLTG